jgi:hypothetical protein
LAAPSHHVGGEGGGHGATDLRHHLYHPAHRGGTHGECVPLRDEVEMNDNKLPSAVIKLVDELDLAFGAPPKPGKEREPFIDALVAVARFARAVGSREAQWELTVLAYALQDLDAGRVAPVVRPTKRKAGSPPDSSITWIMRVRVLAALDALKKSRMTQEEATRYIDSKYPKLQRLMTRGKDLPSTIVRWQREMNEAKKGSFLAPFAQQLFDTIEDARNISAPMSMTPDRWRQFAENMLARIQP